MCQMGQPLVLRTSQGREQIWTAHRLVCRPELWGAQLSLADGEGDFLRGGQFNRQEGVQRRHVAACCACCAALLVACPLSPPAITSLGHARSRDPTTAIGKLTCLQEAGRLRAQETGTPPRKQAAQQHPMLPTARLACRKLGGSLREGQSKPSVEKWGSTSCTGPWYSTRLQTEQGWKSMIFNNYL